MLSQKGQSKNHLTNIFQFSFGHPIFGTDYNQKAKIKEKFSLQPNKWS